MDFVNPYTFVRQNFQVQRGQPVSHERHDEECWSGRIDVTLKARTPLLVGGFSDVAAGDLRAVEGDGPVQDVARRADGRVIVPGSSLAGSVRSLYESMVGGCLRVIDDSFVPVHRHPALVSETRNLRLGVVTAVDGAGMATEVTVGGDTVWISAGLIAAAGGLLCTGDRVDLIGAVRKTEYTRTTVSAGRVVRRSSLSTAVDGTWALLVTDTAARSASKPAYFAAALMGGGAVAYAVDPRAADAYLTCVEDTDDMRLYRKHRKRPQPAVIGPAYEPVKWPNDGGPVVGYRLPARPAFVPGQPVWVRLSGRVVSELRLSQFWRFLGEHSVGERIGTAGPCTDPGDLCPACRVFGSIDARASDDGQDARQSSYRGHVRFADVLVVGAIDGDSWYLAPLASPKPSAGQFYLDNTGRGPTAKDSRSASVWGSAADAGATRRNIRGRKFYWRTESPEQPVPPRRGDWPRGAKRDSANGQASPGAEEMARRVRLVPSGTTFTTQVTFENMTATEVGGLLVALDPRGLTGDGADLVTSVGGGKPFGFGAVTVDAELSMIGNGRSRYLGEQIEPIPTPESLVDLFRLTLDRTVREDLLATLTFGRIPDELVWYPPGQGRQGDESFDEGFDFWQKSTGAKLSREIRPLVSLPSPAADVTRQTLESPPQVRRV